MELCRFLDHIASVYSDDGDIVYLVERMKEDLHVRRQLADTICMGPNRLRIVDYLELAKWGEADWASRFPELREIQVKVQ